MAFNGTYTHAFLTGPAPGVGGVQGDGLPYVPRWNGSVSADYSLPLNSAASAFIGATVQYQSARNAYFSEGVLVGNAPFELGAFTDLALRAGIKTADWRVELFGKNVTNARGQVSATTTAVGGPAQVILIQPANVGLRIVRDF